MALLRRGLRLSGAALAACGSRAARLDEDAAPREATFGVDAVPEAVLPMVLKKPTDEVVFKKPNVDELKMRLATVAAEMEERSRWEAVRVHALLEQVEGSAAKQCAALLRAEADAAGAESAARLSAQRAADAIELEIAVDAKRAANDDKFGALLEAHERATRAEWAAKLEAALAAADGAAQARLEADLDEWTAASAAAALDRAAAAEDIGRELEACFAQIEHKMLEHESQAALHRSTLVVLRCIDALNSQRPADKAVAAARGAGDDVVAAALGPLTPASLKRGVPDLAQLERRFFGAVKGHTARWLMVPDGMDGDVLGHAIGAVLATPLLSNPTRTSLGGPTEPLVLGRVPWKSPRRPAMPFETVLTVASAGGAGRGGGCAQGRQPLGLRPGAAQGGPPQRQDCQPVDGLARRRPSAPPRGPGREAPPREARPRQRRRGARPGGVARCGRRPPAEEAPRPLRGAAH